MAALRLLERLLLPPGAPLFLVLLALLFRFGGRRRTARALAALGALLLYAASIPLVSGALVRGLEREAPPTRIALSPAADAVVVLGGALGPARPPRFRADLSDAADRVLHAARLVHAGKAPLVLVSGGASDGGPPEAPAMAELLKEWGVQADRILVESRSRSTAENARQTALVLKGRGVSRILLVTSALHMARAKALFAAQGLEVVPSPTDYRALEGEGFALKDLLPSADALHDTADALHEHLGRLWIRLGGG